MTTKIDEATIAKIYLVNKTFLEKTDNAARRIYLNTIKNKDPAFHDKVIAFLTRKGSYPLIDEANVAVLEVRFCVWRSCTFFVVLCFVIHTAFCIVAKSNNLLPYQSLRSNSKNFNWKLIWPKKR